MCIHCHCLHIGATNSEKEVVVRQKKALEAGDAVLAPATKPNTSDAAASGLETSAGSNATIVPAPPMSAPGAALTDAAEAAHDDTHDEQD